MGEGAKRQFNESFRAFSGGTFAILPGDQKRTSNKDTGDPDDAKNKNHYCSKRCEVPCSISHACTRSGVESEQD